MSEPFQVADLGEKNTRIGHCADADDDDTNYVPDHTLCSNGSYSRGVITDIAKCYEMLAPSYQEHGDRCRYILCESR